MSAIRTDQRRAREVDPRRDLVRGASVLALVVGLMALRVAPELLRDQETLRGALALAGAGEALPSEAGAEGSGALTAGGLASGALLSALALLLRAAAFLGGPEGGGELGLLLLATLGPLALALAVGAATGAAQGLGLPRRTALLAAAWVGLLLARSAGWPTLEALTAAATAWTWTQVLDLRSARERGRPVGVLAALVLGLGVVSPALFAPVLLPLSLLLLGGAELALLARPRGTRAPEGHARTGLLVAAPLLALLALRIALAAPGSGSAGLGLSMESAGALQRLAAAFLGPAGLLAEAPFLLVALPGLLFLLREGDRLTAGGPVAALLLAGLVPEEARGPLLAAALALGAVPLAAGATALAGSSGGRTLLAVLLGWSLLAASGGVLVDGVRAERAAEVVSEGEAPLQPLLRWRIARREWAVPGAPLPLDELLGQGHEGELAPAPAGPQGHLALGLMGTVSSLLLPGLGLAMLVLVGLRSLAAGLDRARPGP
jgi:hypothetical protein